jgi:hypothetical protein
MLTHLGNKKNNEVSLLDVVFSECFAAVIKLLTVSDELLLVSRSLKFLGNFIFQLGNLDKSYLAWMSAICAVMIRFIK